MTIRTIVSALAITLMLVLVGCPSQPPSKKHKLNADSIIASNKPLADSALKIAPMPAIEIDMDSMRRILRIHPSVEDQTLIKWMTLPGTIVPPTGPGDCQLVVVEFTDLEVSQLFIRVSGEYPAQVNTIVGQMAAPIMAAAPSLLGPNVYSRNCDPSVTADWVQYFLTAPQIAKWSSTSTPVKNQVMAALNSFRIACAVPGTHNVLWITNLGHASLSSFPYTNVLYTTTVYTGNTRIHVIQLLDS